MILWFQRYEQYRILDIMANAKGYICKDEVGDRYVLEDDAG